MAGDATDYEAGFHRNDSFVSNNTNMSSNYFSYEDFGYDEPNDWLKQINVYFKLSLFILGFLGNTLSAIVIRKTNSPATTKIIFTLLALSDNIVLLDDFVFQILNHFHKLNLVDSYLILCKFYTVLYMFCIPFSYWMVALLTIERCIAITLPLKAKIFVNKFKLSVVIVVLVVILLCFSGYVLYSFHLIKFYDDNGFIKFQYCGADTYVHTVLQRAAAVYEVGSPLVIVVVGNIIISTVIWRRRKESERLTGRTRENQDTKLFATTFAVSLCFVLFSTPFNLYLNFGKYVFGDDYFSPNSKVFMIVDMVAHINFAVNFYLYLAFTKSFRDQVRNLFTVCKPDTGKSDNEPSTSTSAFSNSVSLKK